MEEEDLSCGGMIYFPYFTDGYLVGCKLRIENIEEYF